MVATSEQSREISDEFFAAFKLASRERPAYKIGREVGLEPARLSRILHDHIRPADEAHVLALAELVGVPRSRVFKSR